MGLEHNPIRSIERHEQDVTTPVEHVRSLTIDRDGLESLMSRPHTPEEVIGFFEEEFRPAFDTDSGSDGYSIRKHTLMVLRQFGKYFSHESLPAGVPNSFMEVVLALHDIGKPEAILAGSKDRQHEFTVPHVRAAAKALGYSEEQVQLAASLVGADEIGLFLMRKGTAEEIAETIASAAEGTGLTTLEFYNLLKIMYKSDAGSYTVDAGGKASLDNLFEFEPEDRAMEFAPKIQARIDELDAAIGKI